MLFISSLMLLAAFSPALALTSPIMTPGIALLRSSNGSYKSLNWSGYAVTGATGSVTSVTGSWTVPTLDSNTGTALAATWVGIDGFNSNTVEQTGTMIATSSAQSTYGVPEYCAWYEFYPGPMYLITSLTINPSDIISASVTYTASSGSPGGPAFGGLVFAPRDPIRSSSGTFTITITDTTSGKSFSTTGTVRNAARSSAEWITEAPSSSSGIIPLANFGTANYGYYTTDVSGTCYATVSGSTGAIGSFGSSVQTLTMVNSAGTAIATPSVLFSDGTSFSIVYS